MGIRFYCPKGHKLNVKLFLAGKKALCPYCGLKVLVPLESTRPSSRKKKKGESVSSSNPSGDSAVDEAATSISASTPEASQSSVAKASAEKTLLDEPLGMGSSPSVVLNESLLNGSGGVSDADGRDPLAEANNLVWYARSPEGEQLGPAEGSIVQEWLAEGRLKADWLVWRDGWPEWLSAGNVFPQLKPRPVDAGLDSLLTDEPLKPAPVQSYRQEKIIAQQTRNKRILLIAGVVVGIVVMLAVFITLLIKNL
jgi:hypothetical protein